MTEAFVSNMKSKLAKLQNTQQSIQTTSMWLIHHQRHHADEVTSTWLLIVTREMNPVKLCSLMNLANDVIQNSRKKCPDFALKFFDVLEPALKHCVKRVGVPEVMRAITRIIEVFSQREIFSPDRIARLQKILVSKKIDIEERRPEEKKSVLVPYNLDNVSIACSEVVESLRNMVNPASEDAETRHHLVKCPDCVGHPEKLDLIREESEVVNILQQLDDIEPLAKDYCRRLAIEMSQRHAMQTQIDNLLANVRATIEHQETMLKEIKKREEAARHVVDEIKQVYDSLPDLSYMSTGAPLPSADMLFS